LNPSFLQFIGNTNLILLGALENLCDIAIINGISNANGLANNVNATEDAALGGWAKIENYVQ
jgi:hypothetical protein